jgi:hypothetical protein
MSIIKTSVMDKYLELQHENEDYIFKNKYWNNGPGLHNGQLGGEDWE